MIHACTRKTKVVPRTIHENLVGNERPSVIGIDAFCTKALRLAKCCDRVPRCLDFDLASTSYGASPYQGTSIAPLDQGSRRAQGTAREGSIAARAGGTRLGAGMCGGVWE